MNKGAVLAITLVAAACYTAVGSQNPQETESVAQGVGSCRSRPGRRVTSGEWPTRKATERACAVRSTCSRPSRRVRAFARSIADHAGVAFRRAAHVHLSSHAALPQTRHAFNGESISGEPAAQGTQMDALGHFAHFPAVWDGTGSPPLATAEVLQQLHPGAGQADAGFAASQARNRKGAAHRHQRRAARCAHVRRRRRAGPRRYAHHRCAHQRHARRAGTGDARDSGGRRPLHLHRLGGLLAGPRRCSMCITRRAPGSRRTRRSSFATRRSCS